MPYDPHVVNQIKRIAKRRGLPERYVVGALATGIVESGLQDLPGGDADSYGFRQQRESIYGRQPLKKQINNLFNEFAQYDKGQSLGELIADVQRPAAQYRGRYAQVLDQARHLAGKGFGGVEALGSSTMPGSSGVAASAGASAPNIFETLGRLNAPQAEQNPAYAQLQRGWELLAQMQNQRQSNNAVGSSQASYTDPTGTGGKLGGKRRSAFELFFNPLGGQFTSPGHDDHIHFAARPGILRKVARMATKRGLTIKEFEPYDHVDPVHVKDSYHYKGEAEDISGPGMLDFAKLLKKRFRYSG